MSDLLTPEFGQTPLTPDDLVGLRDSSIATRGDLDAAEQASIIRGRRRWWARPPTIEQLLSSQQLRRLHGDMFGAVWSWAGSYRSRLVHITPVTAREIPRLLHDLCLDVRLQLSSGHDVDEVAAHLHHQLVWIHPFPNGNGRWAREATDLTVASSGRALFTWGRQRVADGATADDVRRQYIAALRAADGRDLTPLMTFVRS